MPLQDRMLAETLQEMATTKEGTEMVPMETTPESLSMKVFRRTAE